MAENSCPQTEFNRLPSDQRKAASGEKYAKAVRLYAATALPLRQIAEMAGVSPSALSSHLCRHHRDLVLARYGMELKEEEIGATKIKPQKGQSEKTFQKYREAIEACSDIKYIDLNITQIARIFGLDGSALSSQLKIHYPDVIPGRERIRERLGLNDHFSRGPRHCSKEGYSEAVALYRDTDLTIPEVAERCEVSTGGLSQYLRFYHKDVIEEKSQRRENSKSKAGERVAGNLSGNGQLYGPRPETDEQYAESLKLYLSTPMTVKEAAGVTGVPEAGFTGYMKGWHHDKILAKRKKTTEVTADKYAPAIKSLRDKPRSVAAVAKEFGLNADVFREYLKSHAPELCEREGMALRSDGKKVKRTSEEKYRAAIEEFANSAEPMKEIAERHGLVYKSLMSYVKRNCAAEVESHRQAVIRSNAV